MMELMGFKHWLTLTGLSQVLAFKGPVYSHYIPRFSSLLWCLEERLSGGLDTLYWRVYNLWLANKFNYEVSMIVS